MLVGVQGRGSGLGFDAALTYISVMLPMRKKPPEGLPNINSGKPWSAFDMDEFEPRLPARTK